MSQEKQDTTEDDTIHYPDDFTEWCELDWGEGFLSPGGPEEVAKIIEGIDLSGKDVLDIGVGLAGPACLLVSEHGASRVIGIDVEDPVLKRAQKNVERLDLGDRVFLKRVQPGPLPFADESFDVVFSKDAIIHIPDTQTLFDDIYRILRPGGWLALSDWYCGDDPFTDEMMAWVKRLDLGFAMKPIDKDREYCEAAGFINVKTIDRNSWYHGYCIKLAERLRGPFHKTYVEALGEEGAQNGIAAVDEHIVLTSQGQLRPGHLRGQKAG